MRKPKRCEEKTKYGSPQSAVMAAARQVARNPRFEFRVYRCPVCLLWHTTHQKFDPNRVKDQGDEVR